MPSVRSALMTAVMDSLVLPWVNAEKTSMFLDEVAQRHASEFVVMVVDQAGWHLARELVIPANVRLVFLPPHSPRAQSDGALCGSHVGRTASPTVFADLDAIERVLTGGLLALESDHQKTRSMTAFRGRTSISLKANSYESGKEPGAAWLRSPRGSAAARLLQARVASFTCAAPARCSGSPTKPATTPCRRSAHHRAG